MTCLGMFFLVLAQYIFFILILTLTYSTCIYIWRVFFFLMLTHRVTHLMSQPAHQPPPHDDCHNNYRYGFFISFNSTNTYLGMYFACKWKQCGQKEKEYVLATTSTGMVFFNIFFYSNNAYLGVYYAMPTNGNDRAGRGEGWARVS